MQCRSHAAQLGRLYENFKRHNVEIVLILGEPIDKAKRYSEILRLPFPVLADPDHKIYHQYGLEKILLIQRTASLIIDCDGIVRYLKAATNPMLWLKESQEILNFVQSLAVAC